MRAAVIGAGGAIGRALVERLAADGRYQAVQAFSRRPMPASGAIRPGMIDMADGASIAAAAETVDAPLDLLIIASGLLHEGDRGPERALKELDADWLARVFAVNTIGPSLALRYFAPKLRRDGRAVVAALSARVGSISDNRIGGWYGYRASKAALNMVIRCAAIELGRARPETICVALHPGTVDSGLSRPFQGNVPVGQLKTPDEAAGNLLAVLDGLTPEHTGRIFAWDGVEIAP